MRESRRHPGVVRIDVPRELADVALSRVEPLCHPVLRLAIARELLEQLMLSCYQQGLLDGDQLAGGILRARPGATS